MKISTFGLMLGCGCLAFILGTSSCRKRSKQAPKAPEPVEVILEDPFPSDENGLIEDSKPPLRENEDPLETLTSLIVRSQDELKKDRCALAQSTKSPACAENMVTLDFRSGNFRPNGISDETILIVENEIAHLTVVTRYRSRVKNFYEITDGRLQPANPRVTLPRGLLRLLLRFDREIFVPASQLEAIDIHLGNFVNFDDTGHNKGVSESILEYCPHAPVIFLKDITDLNALFGSKICIEENRSFKQLKQQSEELGHAISAMIESENVRYVNMSFGLTHSFLEKSLEKICGTYSAYTLNTAIELFRPIMEALQEPKNHKFFTAQAAPYTEIGPFDQNKDHGLFFLTGLFNKNESDVLEDGSLGRFELGTDIPEVNLRLLKSEYKAMGLKGDIYLNWHSENRRNAEARRPKMTSNFGFGWGENMSIPSTSLTTPVLLGWLSELRKDCLSMPFDEAAAEIVQSILPRTCPDLPNSICIFQDPLAYRMSHP